MLQEHLGNLIADGQRRVQRLAGVLEDHRDAVAAQTPDPLAREAQQLDRLGPGVVARGAAFAAAGRARRRPAAGPLAVGAALALARGAACVRMEGDGTLRKDAGRDRQQLQERPPGNALAAAGLSDQSQRLAVTDLEADAVDGMDEAALGLEMHRQVFDGSHRGRGIRQPRLDTRHVQHQRPLSVLGSSASRSPSPTRLNASAQRNTIAPGEGRSPPAARGDAGLPLRDQNPPLRDPRLAKSDEGQRRRDQDHVAHVERRLHHHWRDRVRQDVAEVDVEAAVADDPCRVDVLVLLHLDDTGRA